MPELHTLSTAERKKLSELRYGRFLAEQLNDQIGTVYTANSVEDLASHDINLVSNDNRYSDIKVQNTTSHGSTFKQAHINRFRIQQGAPLLPAFRVEYERWIIDAIKDKEKKQYSDVESTILLLEGSIPAPKPNRLVNLKPHIQTRFIGVYYVSLPIATTDEETRYGYVVSLKDYWTHPNSIF